MRQRNLPALVLMVACVMQVLQTEHLSRPRRNHRYAPAYRFRSHPPHRFGLTAALVQSAAGSSNFASTAAATFGSNTTTGNTIFVVVATKNDVAISSISDSPGGNTYSQRCGVATANRLDIWSAENITGGTIPTITVNFSSSETSMIQIIEFSGLATSAFDQTANQTQFTTTTGCTSTVTATLAQANEVFIGAHVNRSTDAGTWTVHNGFSLILDSSTSSGMTQQMHTQYLVVSATTGQESICDHSTSITVISLVGSFKASSAGAGFPPLDSDRKRPPYPHALARM
jgi:hypothetical protein